MFNKNPGRMIKLTFSVVYLFIIIVSYIIAFHIRFRIIDERNFGSFVNIIPWILLISVIVIAIYDLYNVAGRSISDIAIDVFISVSIIFLMTMSASFLFRQFALPRTILFIAYIISICGIFLWNLLISNFLNRKHREVLVIGEIKELKQYINNLRQTSHQNVNFTYCNFDSDIITKRLVRQIEKVDQVLLSPFIPDAVKSHIIQIAIERGKLVYVIPSLNDLLLAKAEITSFDDTMVMAVRPFGLSVDQRVAKRFVDIVLSLVFIVIFSPLFLLASIAIKLESPHSPIFYKQQRLGLNNKKFTIYKFRSMIENAEKDTGPVLALVDDHRITKVGRFIRRTRIDEMPQFFNVLIGDMALVGPRPERAAFIEQFATEIDSYHYRSTVKPGITGYAQVMGKYTSNVEDKLRYDLYYIRNYSLWLDIVILLRTIAVVLNKAKSEGIQAEKIHH